MLGNDRDAKSQVGYETTSHVEHCANILLIHVIVSFLELLTLCFESGYHRVPVRGYLCFETSYQAALGYELADEYFLRKPALIGLLIKRRKVKMKRTMESLPPFFSVL